MLAREVQPPFPWQRAAIVAVVVVVAAVARSLTCVPFLLKKRRPHYPDGGLQAFLYRYIKRIVPDFGTDLACKPGLTAAVPKTAAVFYVEALFAHVPHFEALIALKCSSRKAVYSGDNPPNAQTFVYG